MLKIRSFSICIFLCVLLSTISSFGADYFSNALKMFSEGRFFEASIEFERAVFYENDNNRIARSRYYKALCYKGLGETKKALGELNGINLLPLPDSLFLMIRYEQAFCNFLNKDPGQSLWNLEDIRARYSDSLQTMDMVPLNIISLNALRKWDDAITLWEYYIDHSSLDVADRGVFKEEIKLLYHKRNIPKYRSPRKAEILSRFIPGSGQIYAGGVFEGSFNFFMNAAVLGFSLYEFSIKYYFTGYLAGLAIFNTTYHSGMHRAYLLASQKNQVSVDKFNLRVNSVLKEIMDAAY